jgi:uncharacterized protein (DUF427 family)
MKALWKDTVIAQSDDDAAKQINGRIAFWKGVKVAP